MLVKKIYRAEVRPVCGPDFEDYSQVTASVSTPAAIQ